MGLITPGRETMPMDDGTTLHGTKSSTINKAGNCLPVSSIRVSARNATVRLYP